MAIRRGFSILTALIIGSAAYVASAQIDSVGTGIDTTYYEDGERVYQFAPLTVTGQRLMWSERRTPVDKDDLNRVLEEGGVHLVRRGVFMASDVYLDGFKRGDVEVTIDGERYPNACPNRMDPPTTRVNPLEMDAIVVDRSGAALQSGLGGRIAYRRSEPAEAWRVRGGMTGTGASGRAMDAALAVERRGHRVSAQYVRGEPYEDARGDGFDDLYGYRSIDLQYSRVEVAVQGERGPWRYGTSYSATDDVPFPYLRMDERYDRMWSARLGYRDHKLYVSRTRHLMDNAARTSYAMTFMESDATSLTAGLVGPGYEVYYRHWELWNTFEPRGQAMWQPYRQHMLPDLHTASTSVAHTLDVSGVLLSGRVGLTYAAIGDEERLAFFEPLYPEADDYRWFVPFSLAASYTHPLTARLSLGVLAEVTSEMPEPQYLYISVRKPMGKPYWAGNPTLKAPLKTGLRGTAHTEHLRAEVFAAHVNNYTYPRRATADGQAYVTHGNVDAFLTGITAGGTWPYASLQAAYTRAQNLTDEVPLADVAPLSLRGTLTSPSYHNLSVHVGGRLNAAQTRLDEALGEERTPAWYRLDTGLAYALPHATLRLDVTNLTDRRYYRHLSYLRDPFAAGVHVYEPGRMVRLGLSFDY